MSESQGAVKAAGNVVRNWAIQGEAARLAALADTYPYTVVGTHHRRMDQLSAETRYFVLDCNTGNRYYFKDEFDGEVRTFSNINVAHDVARMLLKKQKPACVVKV